MKKALLLFPLLAMAIACHAQSYLYKFDNNLHEHYGAGPDLAATCPGSYVQATLPIGLTEPVFNFNWGCGLTFNDASNFLSSGSYTIEMYVKLDTIDGYKKLLDFKHLSNDYGLYDESKDLILYDDFGGPDTNIVAGQYCMLTVTRNAPDQNTCIYINNLFEGSYQDADGDYVYDSYKNLVFFQDDSVTTYEQTTGSVAMIRIFNAARDSNTVKNDYNNLQATLSVQNTNIMASLQLYPNPATNGLHVTTGATFNYNVCDITGRSLITGTLMQGDNMLDVSTLAEGMYMLKVTDKEGQTSVYKFIKR